MTLRSYLMSMMLSTFFCWFSFGLILFYVDPTKAGFWGLAAFYASMFFATCGTFTLMGFYLRVWFSKNEVLFSHVLPSFRQAILLSIVLCVSLILQSFRLLSWWNGVILVAACALLEFYLRNERGK